MAERATAQAVALSRLGRRSRVATDPDHASGYGNELDRSPKMPAVTVTALRASSSSTPMMS